MGGRKMTASWIPTRLIEPRLDGTYNNPGAVAARAVIQRFSPRANIRTLSKSVVCGPFGSTLTADEQQADGEVVLIQPTDFSEGLFTLHPGWRVNEETLEEKGLKLYGAGCLLFARVGIYPHCAVLPSRLRKA